MNYTDQIEGVAQTLRQVTADVIDILSPGTVETMVACTDRLYDIALELDKTPRDQSPNCHGAAMELVAAFPYPHPDDRDRLRVALYHKPSSPDSMAGEYIIWSEAREDDHDGFREPSRFWGHYFGYIGQEEKDKVLPEALIELSKKLKGIVGPFKPHAKTARLFNARK